jgi:hypothetical protein
MGLEFSMRKYAKIQKVANGKTYLLRAECGVFYLDFAANNFYCTRNVVFLPHIPPPIIFIAREMWYL